MEGSRIADCSCPRGGGWRPGARWAKEKVQAEIDALPAHQRPPMRELGRRSEAAGTIFRSSADLKAAQGPAPAPRLAPPAYRAGERSALVTSHRVGSRVLVASVSPEAAALGLEAGMALTQARALVPGLEVREADPEADAALLARLGLFAARRWSPGSAVSADGLWLELDGVAHLFGGERAMCARVLAFCARLGLAARIAVAGTAGAAHALARFGGARIVLCPSGDEAQALAPLPLAALRVEEEALGAARRLGLERIGDLLAMPRAPLSRRFGKTLLLRLDQALGRAAEPHAFIVPRDSPCATLRLAEPIATAEAIGQVLGDLMAALVRTLETQGLAVRGLALLCERVDGEVQRVAIGTARATRDGAHLLRLLKARIETIEPGFGIEAMRLVAERAESLAPQPVASVLDGEAARTDLVPLIDRLATRLGARRLFRVGAVESDVPERSVVRVGPLAPTRAWPPWPRPVRLLSPAERVENVVALLPDQPPRRFTWRGRRHVVRQADGPERIHGEWWRSTSEADAVRDYFQVEDEEGARFWLYRRGDGVDGRTGDLNWYLHGVFG
jgi:protein ImuB